MKKVNIYILIGILLLTALVFSNSVFNDFVPNWDDNYYVLNNDNVKNFNFSELISSYYAGNYHPLTMLLFASEYSVFNDDALGYHIVNLCLHLINVFLVFIILQRLTDSKVMISAIVALLFGIHPMHVESVSWVSGLKDVLYASFFLGSIWFYLKFTKKSRNINYIIALILFLLSLLSKSMAVTLPLILILIDYYISRKPMIKHLNEKIPFFVLSIIFGILTIISQGEGMTFEQLSLRYNITDRLFLLSYAIMFYPFKLLAPYNFSALHLYPEKLNGFLPFYYYLSFIALVFVVFGVLFLYRSVKSKENRVVKRSYTNTLVFGLLFYFITILPVLQLLPVGRAIVAERYSYIPYIGLLFVIAHGFYLTWNKKYRIAGKIRPYLAILLIFLIVFSACSTIERNKAWKNDISLFSEDGKEDSGAYKYYVLAKASQDKEQMEEALEYYNKSIELDSSFADAYYNRGNLQLYYFRRQREAAEDYEKAVELDREFKLAYNNLAIAYQHLRRYDEALVCLDRALELDPGYSEAYYNKGFVYQKKKEFELAIAEINKALELKPDYPKAYYQRGLANQKLGHYARALDDYTIARKAFPGHPGLILQIGDVRYELNDMEEACKEWKLSAEMGHKIAKSKLEEYCK